MYCIESLIDVHILKRARMTCSPLYIKSVSENISRILQPFNVRVIHKPVAILRQ